MIKFNCNKCIHNSVCKFRDDATSEIDAYKKRIIETGTFSINLECKHYASICAPTLKELDI